MTRVEILNAKMRTLMEEHGGQWEYYWNPNIQTVEMVITLSTKKSKTPRCFTNTKPTGFMEAWFTNCPEPRYLMRVGNFYQEITKEKAIELVGLSVVEEYESQFRQWQTKVEMSAMFNLVKQQLADRGKTYQGGENCKPVPVYTLDPSVKL